MPPTDGPNPYEVHSDSRLQRSRAAPPHAEPNFDVRENRGVHVITLLRREYVDGNQIERLGTGLQDYFAEKPRAKAVLDMHAVQQFSSAALGVLLDLKKAIEGAGGAFAVASVRPQIIEVFEMTNLHKILRIEAHVADAIGRL